MADDRLIFGLAERHYVSLATIFARFPGIREVVLYGSRARGTARPDADFDLAVMAPEMTNSDFSRLWNAVDSLPLVFRLDLVHWDRLGRPVLQETIVREGVRFYPLPPPTPLATPAPPTD